MIHSKKIVSIMLLMGLLTILFSTTIHAVEFSDVTQKDYFYNAVRWGVESGIVSGSGNRSFLPDDNCTKAQILTFLWRASGFPEPSGSNPYRDVPENSYYYKAAVWAYKNGLSSSETFNANEPCTRALTVTYLWKLAGSPTIKGDTFFDVPSTADYANAVRWAIDKGITAGTGSSTFSPSKICTRGQIITFIYRSAGFETVPKPSLQARVTDVYFKTIHEYETGSEYALITGKDTQGNVVWTYTSEKHFGTELRRVDPIGIRGELYYFNNGGAITALNLQIGSTVWSNPDFRGASTAVH